MTESLNCPAVTCLSPVREERVPFEVAMLHYLHRLDELAQFCEHDADDFGYVAELIAAAADEMRESLQTMTAPSGLPGGA